MDLEKLVEREGQARVAEAAECSQSLISLILAGKRNLTPIRAKKLSAAFDGVTLRSLLPELYEEERHHERRA